MTVLYVTPGYFPGHECFCNFMWNKNNMGKMNIHLNDWRNLLINAGFHCMVLGMLGVLAILFAGFITCCMDFPSWVFYALLGGGLILGIIGAVFCLRCNCSFFHKTGE